MNVLPNIDTKNIKNILIRGLRSKIDELGPLRVPFDITTDYPSKLAYDINSDTGPVPTRRIVIKKLSNTTRLNAIGDNVASTSFFESSAETGYDTYKEVTGQGWVEDYTMEISVWATDFQDRDNIIELIKMWMLELTHRNLEEGAPFFLQNGVFSVNFQKAYESEDTKIINEGVYFVGIMVYTLANLTYGVTLEEYERVKIALTNEILDFNPPILIIPNPPNPPASGGVTGQNPSEIVMISDGAGVSDGKPTAETLNVGGGLRTDGSYPDEIIKRILR